MPQHLIELGGAPDAPLMHIAIANGFSAETYRPLLEPFFADYRVVCLPLRALWHNAPKPPPITGTGWRIMADDMLAGMRQFQLENVIALGHSMGGIASMLAAFTQPQRFSKLILLDPTILTKNHVKMLGKAQQAGVADQFFMAQNALKRRNHFESVEAAYEHFASKRLFENWPERTLRLYVEDGTKPAPDGDGLVLRFDPAWEAYYFASAYTAVWDNLPRLNNLLPTLFVQGADSHTFLPPSYEAVQEIVPSADYRQVEGHGHLFPQSAPTETAQIIREWLASVDN